jgi:CsoR family transcriptional regulator, copper-sensing transcriptional repressor
MGGAPADRHSIYSRGVSGAACVPRNSRAAANFPVPLSAARQAELKPRLRRIEGQVRGILKMVEERRYCVEILQQISATVQALNGVSKRVLRNYLETCATEAIRSGDRALAHRVYDEITDLFRFAR